MRTSVPTPQCRHCGNPMSPPKSQRGRPADYCGRACRQAAYRERQRQRGGVGPGEAASPPLPDQSPERLLLLELAHDTQEELRHLVRLLSNSHQVSAAEILEYSVKVQRRLEAVTAGVVLMARRRRIPWEALGQILSISPETARHTYHERLVQRRLGRYAPASASAPAPGVDSEVGEEAEDAAPVRRPAPPTLRATNQLAPVLSRLQSASGIPLRQLGLRTQVSASYLSRVLSGEKFPTWELTEKIALVLGADSEAVRKVWLDEQARNGSRSRRPRPRPPAGEAETGTSLGVALRTLYRRADCPTPHSLAVATGHLVSADGVRRILHSEGCATWEQVAALIRALDGEPSFFRPHWEEGRQAAPAPAPQPLETATHRLDQLLTTFGDTFHEARTLVPSPGRSDRRRELRRWLVQAARASG